MTDVRFREAEFTLTRYAYRTPLKFGGVPNTHSTVLHVRARVEGVDGRSAWGDGEMPLGNTWSWPSKTIPAAQTLAAMEALAAKLARALPGEAGHPVELGHAWEADVLRLAGDMPKLAALVVASAFDAALHDAYGRLHQKHVWEMYGPEFLRHDLSHYLDGRFKGETLDRYVLAKPKPRMPLYHLVGALDALTDADVKERLNDGLPNTLGEWIRKDELTHLKIKLNGNDAAWDVERVVAIDAVAGGLTYSLDFNEQCPNVEYLVDVLSRIRERSPRAFERTAYVEQPTARDLKAHPENKMHAAAKLKPVVIDESLVDFESLMLAREQGYTGAALKACKGQGQSMLMAAAAQKFGMFLCVQDLTCPGLSFMESAGLAAHVGPVTAIEGNARQYCPAANAEWARKLPTLFTIKAGHIDTSVLSGVGLTC